MKQRANGQSKSITGVLFRTGKKWRGLIAEINGTKPRLIAWEEFDASRLSRIDTWLAKHGATSVIGVLPASTVICRTCTLPDADQTQLELALQLQVESHLPDSSAPHRQAMAVLENAPGETNRTGIMVSWPETAQFAVPMINLPVRYAPDITSLAALLNGHRPSKPLLWLDQTDGSIAIAITHAAGAAFRATREHAKFAEQWQNGVGRVLAETALDAGHSAQFTEDLVDSTKAFIKDLDNDTAALLAPNEIFDQAELRVQGAPVEDTWWQSYGLAVGILLAKSSQLSPLTELLQEAPVQTPSLASRITSRFSNKKTATAIITSCLVIAAIWPLVAARIRLTALNLKFPSITLKELEAQSHQVEAKVAMYQELKTQAWPMTKLLSDIACNTPRGIEVQSIDLRHKGELLSITGTTKPFGNLSAHQVVEQMQENLIQTGIFTKFIPTVRDPNNFGAYTFILSGKIVQPYRIYNYPVELDFGTWSLRERLYRPGSKPGETQASDELASANNEITSTDSQPLEIALDNTDSNNNTTIEQPGEAVADATKSGNESTRGTTSRFPRNNLPRNPGSPLNAADDRATGIVTPSGRDIPEQLSAGQIDVLTLDEVNESLDKVSRALQRGHPDAETKTRLREEFRLLFARKRLLQ